MREYLEIVGETVQRFEVFKNCVYQSFPKADICIRLSFKEALRILQYEVERASKVTCSPDFWDTLEFRAREWSSR